MINLIQRVPLGLLDLLGLKSTGQNPNILSDTVSPVVDLSYLYLVQNWQTISGTTNAINATGIFGTSPWWPSAGELFIVDTMAAYPTAVLGAGTTIRFRMVIYDTQTLQALWAQETSSTGTAGELPTIGTQGPIIVTAGQGLAIQCEAITLGVAPTFRIIGRSARVRV